MAIDTPPLHTHTHQILTFERFAKNDWNSPERGGTPKTCKEACEVMLNRASARPRSRFAERIDVMQNNVGFWQSETERLNIWFFSGFSFDNLLHRNRLACQISTKAIRLTAWGEEGGAPVCWYYRSNSELWSCLIVAYCSFFFFKVRIFMTLKWSRKLKI